MAHLRLKYDRSRSPDILSGGGPQIYGSENQNTMNEQNGNGISILSSQPLSDGRARRDHETKNVLRVANAEIDELKQGLNYAEFQLAKVIQEKEAVESQRRDQSYKMQDLNTKLRQRDAESQAKDDMYRQLESQLNQKDHQQNTILGQTSDKLNQLQREITHRESEIGNLRRKIKDREMNCDAAIVSDTLNKYQVHKLQGSNDNKDQEIKDLRQKLFDTQKQLDQVVLSRKSEGTALLQAEHYRVDNERLIKLLASTKEFKNFAEFAADSGSSVRYLDPQRQPTSSAAFPKYETKLKNLSENEEMEDWIPEDAFKVAHDFRNRCAGQVSAPLMNQFLRDLNKIWKAREDKQISRIKSECNREVQFLRRQVQFKKPYEKVMHQADVKRLKGDLKTAKGALRENVAVIKQDQAGPNKDGLIVIDQTLKYTNEIQIERRRLREEKDALQSQLDNMKLTKKEEKDDREKFYEGAAWLGRQSLQVADDAVRDVDTLKMEYMQKLAQNPTDDFMKGRAAEWLLDSTIRIQQKVKDENQRLMEKSMRNNAN